VKQELVLALHLPALELMVLLQLHGQQVVIVLLQRLELVLQLELVPQQVR
jgi:hypothetical protein